MPLVTDGVAHVTMTDLEPFATSEGADKPSGTRKIGNSLEKSIENFKQFLLIKPNKKIRKLHEANI